MNNNKVYQEKIKAMVQAVVDECYKHNISAHIQLILDPLEGSKTPNNSTTSFSLDPRHDDMILTLQDIAINGWYAVSPEDINRIQALLQDQQPQEYEKVDLEKMN